LRCTAAFAKLEGSINETAASRRLGRRLRSERSPTPMLTAMGWFRTWINLVML